MSALGSTAIQVVGIIDSIGGLFGSGDRGAKAREVKRRKLSGLGFQWNRTKGKQPEDRTNIDGFYDQALENLARAYQVYGNDAVEVHNAGMLTDQKAKNWNQLSNIIQDYRNRSRGQMPNFRDMITSAPGEAGQAGSLFSARNIILAVGAYVLFNVMRG